MITLGAWIKAARKHKQLTQDQLANELGMTKGNVSGWENLLHEPSFGQLLRVRDLTGYPLTSLTGDGDYLLSDELRARLFAMSTEDMRRIENSIRGSLEMALLPKADHPSTAPASAIQKRKKTG